MPDVNFKMETGYPIPVFIDAEVLYVVSFMLKKAENILNTYKGVFHEIFV